MSKGTSVIPMLPMEILLKLPLEDLLKYAKDAVHTGEKAKSFSQNHRATFGALGKVIAALKKRFNAESAGSSLVSTMSFAEYFELKTGGKVNNHANECARTYGFFVENSLITEKDYDDNPNDNLEKAARVITAIKGDLTHAVANEAADILKRRPKDAAKQLLALVEKVEGPKTVEGDKAKEWLTKIFASGHLELVIAAVGAEIAHLENLDQAKRAFFAMDTAMGCFECNKTIPREALVTWVAELEAERERPKKLR